MYFLVEGSVNNTVATLSSGFDAGSMYWGSEQPDAQELNCLAIGRDGLHDISCSTVVPAICETVCK